MITATYPLSRAQQGMWFVEQLRGATSIYHDHEMFRLRGPLAVDAFHTAVELLVGRHEVLRTRFVVVGGQPHQFVGFGRGLSIRGFDLDRRAVAEFLVKALMVHLLQRRHFHRRR